jgi:hypothetical protein
MMVAVTPGLSLAELMAVRISASVSAGLAMFTLKLSEPTEMVS